MRCPSCHTEVPDDAVVCPSCEAVVDPSLLNLEPGPSKPSARSGARKAVRKGAPLSGVKKRASRPAQAGDEDTKNERGGEAPGDWRSRLSAEDWQQSPKSKPGAAPTSATPATTTATENAAPGADDYDPDVDPVRGRIRRRANPNFVADKGLDADEFMSEAKAFLNGLSGPDKLTFFAAVTMVVACFFPWKETVVEGEVPGLMSQGVLVFLLGGVVMGVIVARTRDVFPKLNKLFLWVAQIGALGLSVVWVVVCMKLFWDPTLARASIGNEQIWVSKPSFGAIFALIAAVVGVVGTVLELKG